MSIESTEVPRQYVLVVFPRNRKEIISYTAAKTRSDRDFEMRLCYTPKAFSCLEEIKYKINHCLELAPSFPKMYNITMF